MMEPQAAAPENIMPEMGGPFEPVLKYNGFPQFSFL